MYSLKCSYYKAEFPTIGDLIAHIMIPEWIRIMKLPAMAKAREKWQQICYNFKKSFQKRVTLLKYLVII